MSILEVEFFEGQEVRIYHPNEWYEVGYVSKINLKAPKPYVDVDFSDWEERFRPRSFVVSFSELMNWATNDLDEFLLVTERGLKLSEFVKHD